MKASSLIILIKKTPKNILKTVNLAEKDIVRLRYIKETINLGSIMIYFKTKHLRTAEIQYAYYNKTKKATELTKVPLDWQIYFRMERSNGFVVCSYLEQIDQLVKDLKTAKTGFEDLCNLISKNPDEAESIVKNYKKLKGNFEVSFADGKLMVVILPAKAKCKRDTMWTPRLMYDVKENKKMLGINDNQLGEWYDYKKYDGFAADVKSVATAASTFKKR